MAGQPEMTRAQLDQLSELAKFFGAVDGASRRPDTHEGKTLARIRGLIDEYEPRCFPPGVSPSDIPTGIFRSEIDPVQGEPTDRSQYRPVKFRIPISECEACEQLQEIYDGCFPTDRQYWLMTELFVKLHGGKDVCAGGIKP